MLPAMTTQGPTAVIFDNDGLLLDTESVWTRAEQDLFERRGKEFTPADKLELVGTSAEIAGGVLEGRLEEPGRAAELIEELNELVIAELEHGVEAMIGARELLARVARARHADRPCLQLADRLRPPLARDRRLRGSLRRRRQRPRSRCAEAGARPLPRGLSAPRRSSAGPEVVALEDSPTGVAAARAAGLTVIGIPSVEGVALDEAHHIAASPRGRGRRPQARTLTLRLKVRSSLDRLSRRAGHGAAAGPARRSRPTSDRSISSSPSSPRIAAFAAVADARRGVPRARSCPRRAPGSAIARSSSTSSGLERRPAAAAPPREGARRRGRRGRAAAASRRRRPSRGRRARRRPAPVGAAPRRAVGGVRRRWPDVDVAGAGVAADRDLLAGAEADPHGVGVGSGRARGSAGRRRRRPGRTARD